MTRSGCNICALLVGMSVGAIMRKAIRYYPLNVNIRLYYQETCLGMFVTALFIIPKIKQLPSKEHTIKRLETIQWPFTVWINKLWYISTMQYFRIVRMTEPQLHTGFLYGLFGLCCSCPSRPCSPAPGWDGQSLQWHHGLLVQALLPSS